MRTIRLISAEHVITTRGYTIVRRDGFSAQDQFISPSPDLITV